MGVKSVSEEGNRDTDPTLTLVDVMNIKGYVLLSRPGNKSVIIPKVLSLSSRNLVIWKIGVPRHVSSGRVLGPGPDPGTVR